LVDNSDGDGAGSIIGAIMVLAPRIMRGELDKLPPHYEPSRGSARRSEKALDELQRKLVSDNGIGEGILCDFLHGIPGFTGQAGENSQAIEAARPS
jgi:hypothetical protein